MEVGKGQQAADRKNLGDRTRTIVDNEQHSTPTAHSLWVISPKKVVTSLDK